MFFKAAVQGVLLFGSETWVLIPHMGRTLGSFQHTVAWQITGRHPWRQEEGGREYLPVASAMRYVGFDKTGVYILKRQNMVAQ